MVVRRLSKRTATTRGWTVRYTVLAALGQITSRTEAVVSADRSLASATDEGRSRAAAIGRDRIRMAKRVASPSTGWFPARRVR